MKLSLKPPSLPEIQGNPPIRIAIQSNKPLIIGIDPGTDTGLAIWDRHKQTFSDIKSYTIHKAMDIVKSLKNDIERVVLEQPPINFGARNQFRAQGAGSIKRDYKIWRDFLTDLEVSFIAKQPNKRTLTKLNKENFTRLTGWSYPTNQHARDAAMWVWGAE